MRSATNKKPMPSLSLLLCIPVFFPLCLTAWAADDSENACRVASREARLAATTRSATRDMAFFIFYPLFCPSSLVSDDAILLFRRCLLLRSSSAFPPSLPLVCHHVLRHDRQLLLRHRHRRRGVQPLRPVRRRERSQAGAAEEVEEEGEGGVEKRNNRDGAAALLILFFRPAGISFLRFFSIACDQGRDELC